MAQTTQRAFALSLAILFLITTVGFSGYVIWQMYHESKTSKTAAETAAQQKDAKSQANQEVAKEDPLKGQPLPNFTPVAEVTELQVIDQQVGDGAEVKADSTVSAHYTGAVASTGIIFESSMSGDPVTFPLNQVIEGWKEGLVGMKAGGKRRLIIPAAKAYGEQSPSADIPANSALVFDIELVSVQ